MWYFLSQSTTMKCVGTAAKTTAPYQDLSEISVLGQCYLLEAFRHCSYQIQAWKRDASQLDVTYHISHTYLTESEELYLEQSSRTGYTHTHTLHVISAMADTELFLPVDKAVMHLPNSVWQLVNELLTENYNIWSHDRKNITQQKKVGGKENDQCSSLHLSHVAHTNIRNMPDNPEAWCSYRIYTTLKLKVKTWGQGNKHVNTETETLMQALREKKRKSWITLNYRYLNLTIK